MHRRSLLLLLLLAHTTAAAPTTTTVDERSVALIFQLGGDGSLILDDVHPEASTTAASHSPSDLLPPRRRIIVVPANVSLAVPLTFNLLAVFLSRQLVTKRVVGDGLVNPTECVALIAATERAMSAMEEEEEEEEEEDDDDDDYSMITNGNTKGHWEDSQKDHRKGYTRLALHNHTERARVDAASLKLLQEVQIRTAKAVAVHFGVGADRLPLRQDGWLLTRVVGEGGGEKETEKKTKKKTEMKEESRRRRKEALGGSIYGYSYAYSDAHVDRISAVGVDGSGGDGGGSAAAATSSGRGGSWNGGGGVSSSDGDTGGGGPTTAAEPGPNKERRAGDSFSVVLYLNSQGVSFVGGELCFVDTDADRLVEPAAGRVVMFTGGPENVHRVEPVQVGGTRYAIAMWFQIV